MWDKTFFSALAATVVFTLCGCGSSTSSTTAPADVAPSITSIAPSQVVAGSGATTLSITGSGFTTATTVEVAGIPDATTYISSTQISVAVTAAQTASVGTFAVIAKNGKAASTSAVSLTVTVPSAPILASVSPATALAGSSATTVTLLGQNFTPATTVTIDGIAVPDTYISPTSVTIVIPATDLTNAGTLSIVAKNLTAASAAVSFTVTAVAAPLISSISPASFSAGAPATTVVLSGSGFTPATTVEVDNAVQPSTYLSPTSLSFVMPANKLASAGTLKIVAKNGAAGSSPVSQPVANTVPTVSLLVPASFLAGTAGPQTISIQGTGFLSDSTITVNGVVHVATYVSSNTLTTTISTAEMAVAGTLPVIVHSPAPGGGDSNPVDMTISTALALTSMSPSSVIAGGSSPLTLTLTGSGFTPSTVVEVNGGAHPSTFVNSTTIQFALTPVEQSSPGTIVIRVRTSTGSPYLYSAALNFVVNNTVGLDAITPAELFAHSGDTTLHLYGSNMPSDPIVHWRHLLLTSTIVDTSFTGTRISPTEITVTIPASMLSVEGIRNVWIQSASQSSQNSKIVNMTLIDPGYIQLTDASISTIVYNSVNGKFYLSPVPSTSSYTNSIVPFDPIKHIVELPIAIADNPGALAVTDDGQYLWVSLPALHAVQRVNLTTGIADPPFTLPAVSGESNPVALYLLPLPGQPNSVFISMGYTTQWRAGIFDAGVQRDALQDREVLWARADSTKSEIYAAGNYKYTVFGYDASGLTQKVTRTNSTYYTSEMSDIAVAGSNMYTSYGAAYTLAAGLPVTATYNVGAVAADVSLNRLYTVDDSGPFGSAVATQYAEALHTYDLSTGTPVLTNELPLLIFKATTHYGASRLPMNLTRWGANGLAFRSISGMYSLRSVAAAPVGSTELGVTAVSAGTPAKNTPTSYTVTVINNGGAATNVLLSTIIPDNVTFSSITSTAGSCAVQGAVRCSLGAIASGATASVTYTVVYTAAGPSGMEWKVEATQTDSNTVNDSATVSVKVSN